MRGLETRSKSYEKTERTSDSGWDSLSEYERFPYSPQEFGEKLLEIDRLLREFGGGEKSDLDQMRGQESEENILGNGEPQNKDDIKTEGQRMAEESIKAFENAGSDNSSDEEQKNETPISGLF